MEAAVAHYRKSDGHPQSVYEHLKSTAELSSSFAGKIGLPLVGELNGLLHDVGKYAEVFQAYLKSAAGKISPHDERYVEIQKMKGRIDHSTAGAQFVYERLRDQDPLHVLTSQIVSLCIASHHSGLIDCLTPDGTNQFGKRMEKSRSETHLDEVLDGIDEHLRARVHDLLQPHVLTNEIRQRLGPMFAGAPSREVREFMLGLLVRYLLSALIDADRLNTAGFERQSSTIEQYDGSYREWDTLIEQFEQHIANFKIEHRVDEIRNSVAAACLKFSSRERGAFQLTVPTGGGKTLASLRFALHHAKLREMDRIIYVIPYTSIIDQNAQVARSIFSPLEQNGKLIVLEHHSNLMPEKDTVQHRILSENWDAPIVFTTMVQFLETLFSSGTRSIRRMHQLANAILIFDEVQTLPIRVIHLFNNAINFLVGQCGATAVFCTATQPLLDTVDKHKGAARLSPNPQMVPNAETLFVELHRARVIDERKAGGWSEEEVAETALHEMRHAGSALVVVNTKSQARNLYELCKKEKARIYHLSTCMCPAHRMAVLDSIRERLNPAHPQHVLCVSTQLIEAGIHIDFGTVIRYLAGLDSIVQAAGRCNRNGLRTQGRVLLINPSRENLEKLHDIRQGKEAAERVLDEHRADSTSSADDVQKPAAIARYYDYYFYARAHEMTYPVTRDQIGRDDSLFSLLSTNNLSVEAYKRTWKTAPPMSLRQSFHTAAEIFKAIDTPTEGVIVPYGEGERIIAKLSATQQPDEIAMLLRQAQRYSVNMFPHEISRLRERHRLHEIQGIGVLYLDSRHYSDEFGASVDQVCEMESYIV